VRGRLTHATDTPLSPSPPQIIYSPVLRKHDVGVIVLGSPQDFAPLSFKSPLNIPPGTLSCSYFTRTAPPPQRLMSPPPQTHKTSKATLPSITSTFAPGLAPSSASHRPAPAGTASRTASCTRISICIGWGRRGRSSCCAHPQTRRLVRRCVEGIRMYIYVYVFSRLQRTNTAKAATTHTCINRERRTQTF
jgi:hypothetical protein